MPFVCAIFNSRGAMFGFLNALEKGGVVCMFGFGVMDGLFVSFTRRELLVIGLRENDEKLEERALMDISTRCVVRC